MPSPEHGRSHRIRSKTSCRCLKSSDLLFVTMVFPAPHFVMFSLKICALLGIISFAMRVELLERYESNNVDFPPGAAQRSNAVISLLPIYLLIRWAINIDEASCT